MAKKVNEIHVPACMHKVRQTRPNAMWGGRARRTCFGLATTSPSVRHAVKHGQGVGDGGTRPLAAELADKPDSARIHIVRRLEEALRRRHRAVQAHGEHPAGVSAPQRRHCGKSLPYQASPACRGCDRQLHSAGDGAHRPARHPPPHFMQSSKRMMGMTLAQTAKLHRELHPLRQSGKEGSINLESRNLQQNPASDKRIKDSM